MTHSQTEHKEFKNPEDITMELPEMDKFDICTTDFMSPYDVSNNSYSLHFINCFLKFLSN